MKKRSSNCPVHKTAELLSDLWTMLIIHALQNKPLRFCELQHTLDGISTRTLTLKLKKLESLDLITKNTDGAYIATEKGTGLSTVIRAMKKYGEKYLADAPKDYVPKKV